MKIIDMGMDSQIDQFVISTGLRIPEQRVAPTVSVEGAPDPSSLQEAVQQLGAALRKERLFANETLKELDAFKVSQNASQQKLKKQIEELIEAGNRIKADVLREQGEKKELLRENHALTRQLQETRALLQKQTLKDREEADKLRFEQELQKTAQNFHEQKLQQLQRENAALQQELERLRQEHQRAANQHQEYRTQAESDARASQVHQESLLRKIAELNTELAQFRAGFANQTEIKTRAEQVHDAYRRLHSAHLAQQGEMSQLRRQLNDRAAQNASALHRASELQAQLEAERNDKHLVLATLRTTEMKLARAEANAADLETALTQRTIEIRDRATQSRAAHAHSGAARQNRVVPTPTPPPFSPKSPEPLQPPPPPKKMGPASGARVAANWDEPSLGMPHASPAATPDGANDWPGGSMSEAEFNDSTQGPSLTAPRRGTPAVESAQYIVAYPATLSGEA